MTRVLLQAGNLAEVVHGMADYTMNHDAAGAQRCLMTISISRLIMILLFVKYNWNFRLMSVNAREFSCSKQLSTLPILGQLSQIIWESPGCRQN